MRGNARTIAEVVILRMKINGKVRVEAKWVVIFFP
jgi:hypothetical protein